MRGQGSRVQMKRYVEWGDDMEGEGGGKDNKGEVTGGPEKMGRQRRKRWRRRTEGLG